MNKRLVLAIALSFLVMMVWSRMTKDLYHVERQEVTEQIPQPTPPLIPPEEERPETLVSAISQGRELVFSLPSACLKKVIYSEFEDYVFNLEQGFCLAEQELVFTQERLDSEQAIFIHQDEQRRITQQFNYSDPNFIITLDIKIENLSEQSLPYPSSLILGGIDFQPKESEPRKMGIQLAEVFLKHSDEILRLNPREETKVPEGGEFFGFRNNYFCAILIPISFPEALQIMPVSCTKGFFRMSCAKSQIVLSRPMINLLPNQNGHLKYEIYLGPQQAELLKSFYDGAEEVIFYGKLDFIAKLLLKILRFFFHIVHNWGLAIIILSILISFILLPLTLKQMHSAKQTQSLQPKMAELERRYKDNPQRLSKGKLELLREHKINPLGCLLPMLLQAPIFISFYVAAMRMVELKGAHFLWIKDLARPDRLITSPEINILPILMAIIMFLQQKLSTQASSGPAGEQQRLMSFIFPIMFGFIFYRMPSGLVLYWLVNSLLMFVYQMKMKVADESAQH